jgi:hypothetical protein
MHGPEEVPLLLGGTAFESRFANSPPRGNSGGQVESQTVP